MLTIEQAQAHPLWTEQEALETEMRSMGIEAFRKRVEAAREHGQETRTAPMRKLMHNVHFKMVDAINAFFAEVESKKAGRKHSAYPYLKGIDDVDLVAHLTTRIILDVVAQRKRLSHIAVMIGEALEDECNFRHFKEAHQAGYRKAVSRAKGANHAGYRRKSTLGTARGLGVELTEWPKRDMVLVGSKLVELFVETSGLVRLHKQKDDLLVEMVPEARKWVEEECSRSEWLAPTYMPTIIPPKPWTSAFSGGYWTGRARRLTLAKTRNRAYLQELSERDMPEVYSAINALQDTAWAVNRRVLDVIEHFWANPSTIGIIPSDKDDLKLPEKPEWLVEGLKKEDMTEAQQAVFMAWKGATAQVREEMAEMEGRRIAFSRMLWVARKFRDREFFYPHQLDWRGRAYPVSLYLTPQGNDVQRGLLEFATTCPIKDETGALWLAVHGAGLWGVDKVSMEERQAWVEAHSAQIEASAADPLGNLFWTEAEKPWQALAFCFDWAGFKREGFAFESALPCQMDGTCNGLQNFSAILRDEIGGAAVNLVPADKPQDIYARVAELVAAQVMLDAGLEVPEERPGMTDAEKAARSALEDRQRYAAGWVGKVNRKVAKRPVMTLAYGAKRFGFTTMIHDDTVKVWKAESPDTFPFGNQGFQAAQYLAGLVWEKVGDVVVAARQAMDWLQEAAKVVTKEGLPIFWTTPTGFLVNQAYHLRNMKQIEMTFEKVRITVTVDQGSEKLDGKKQASGIAPNWVHSLDASHMMRTIHAAAGAGMEAFSFIHDSYGTHAGNAEALAVILREEFVRMYGEMDVLQDFKETLEAAAGVTLPPLPAKGTLDLSDVLKSRFFFA